MLPGTPIPMETNCPISPLCANHIGSDRWRGRGGGRERSISKSWLGKKMCQRGDCTREKTDHEWMFSGQKSTVENSHLNFSAVIWGIFTTYFGFILWPRTQPVYVAFVVRIENLISWLILKSCFWTPNTNFPRGIRVTLSPDVLSPCSWKFVFCLLLTKCETRIQNLKMEIIAAL